MASHDDDRRRPPEEFQKLEKMTEKKWNVYRRPITLVLNVGLFVSTYSNYFTGKRMSWTFFFVKSIQFNYFGINDMVDKWLFSEIGFFFSLRPFFIFYLGLNHFLKGMSVSHVTVCSSKDLWLIILWKSLEIRIFNTQKYLFRMIHVKKIKGSCYWSWTPIKSVFLYSRKNCSLPLVNLTFLRFLSVVYGWPLNPYVLCRKLGAKWERYVSFCLTVNVLIPSFVAKKMAPLKLSPEYIKNTR